MTTTAARHIPAISRRRRGRRCRRVKAQVEAGGGTMANIVKVNTYLTDIRHRADYAAIREEFFGKKMPASTLVAVSALAQPEFLIEIEAVAVL